jgi:ABC-type uncharacterized transport system involved in gliding motility auxiliary subunit
MKRNVYTNRFYKFLIYCVVIVLINIAAVTLFFRLDLTSSKVYSLSEASRKVVATLSEPLTIKVFFNSNLPAPYNNIERYLHDLLEEYAIAGNRYFNYQFYTVSGEENEESAQNQELARNYGVRPVQIQAIEQDEVKFQNAYMGAVLIHGDIIESIPTITSTEGLEYQITSAIQKMNNKISALLRLKEKISVKLFLSSSLKVVGPYMNITGLARLPEQVEDIVNKLNGKTYGKLSFAYFDPSANHVDGEAAKRFNVIQLNWKEFRDRRGQVISADTGYAGIVVEHGDRFENIKLIEVFRLPLFGTQYQLADLNDLEKAIDETVENVIDINEEIGYLADHGTMSLGPAFSMPGQPRAASLASFNKLLSAHYSVKQVNLKDSTIPDGLSFMIIAGAKENFSEYELYQIDQFLMRGNNLALFMDSFNEVSPQGQQAMMNQFQRPYYMPINTGLEKLLNHYGLNLRQSIVLDENSYKQRMPRSSGGGQRIMYFAPIIKNELINKNADYLKNIKGLVMIKSSPVGVDEQKVKDHGLNAMKLFSSSERSWEMSERIDLNPMTIRPPADKSEFKSMALAYTIEGSFPSYFADKPIPEKAGEDNGQGAEGDDEKDRESREAGVDMSEIKSESVTVRQGKRARIFLIGTSEILKDNVIDAEGNTPNAQFVMNIIDYMNNREDIAVMRSKTQKFNPLQDISPAEKTTIKTANIAGLPILVIVAGSIVWFRRSARKRMIQKIFSR